MDPITKKVKHVPIDSCLMPLAQAHHQVLTTIEYLGSLKKGLNPIQKSFVEHHGTQCGYCTPGFIMNTYSLLLENPNPTNREFEERFDGNLCRCTGYRGIIESIREFTSDKHPVDSNVKCPNNLPTIQVPVPTLPAEFEKPSAPVEIKWKNSRFCIPTSLDQLLALKKKYPEAVIVVGNSEIGFQTKSEGMTAPCYISTHQIPELYHLSIKDNKLTFGASTSLQDILVFCKKMEKVVSPEQARLLRALHERLTVFAGTMIRETASVAGNILFAGGATDMTNFCLATDPILTVIDAKTGEKRQENMEDFFVNYRTTKLRKTDVLTQIEIPLLSKEEHVSVFKQAHRREDDICICSACMKVNIDDKTNTVRDIKLGYSGLSGWPLRAKAAERNLIGKQWTLENVQSCFPILEKEFPLPKDAYGGHAEFRRELARSFLFRFYHQVQKERGLPYEHSAVDMIPRSEAEFTVTYDPMTGKEKPTAHEPMYVHVPKHHATAAQQTTGEATYVDDMKLPRDGLEGCWVQSTEAHAKIVSADYSECLKAPGVYDVVTYKDITGMNKAGDVILDETILAEDEVKFVGHPIAIVLADTREHAREAARLAKIKYSPLEEVLTIKQAIDKKQYFSIKHHITRGDVEKGLAMSDNVIEGEFNIGGQEHFYFEPHVAMAIPGEDSKLTVYSSSQNPTFCQLEASRVTGIPMNKIDVHVKRLGGGFGGKETRASMLVMAASVAAHKTGRPVKIALDRNQDMQTMGTRHPFYCHYKAGFSNDGILNAVWMDHYADGGWSLDLSQAISDRCLFHSDSSYYCPNFHTEFKMCQTNLASNTAFRGFGGPQGINAMEAIMEQIALKLKMPVEEIRRKNLYSEGQMTHFNSPLFNCKNREAWALVQKNFDFAKKKEEVAEFNRTHTYKKRGICMTPLKFGISFTFGTLNQAGALVHVYKDGSVLVSHGGTEMGQGLHTKMLQVAAQTLGVPVEKCRIDETSTDHVANTSPTAASSGADLNGQAVYNACMQIKARLEKYRKGRTWEQACMAAYMDRADLCAHGFYATPDVGYSFDTGLGNPFAYFVYGAAASLVEIDCLTGDHQVLRSDVMFDIGDSLNPAIDIGQLEGAFVQGYGYLTMEEKMIGDNDKYKWIKPGVNKTNGPGYYKIPGYNDVPMEFHVGLLPNSHNPIGVYSSKAVGEPPLILANSAAFALIDAVRAARRQNGLDEWFNVEFPFTADSIRVLSGTKLDKEK